MTSMDTRKRCLSAGDNELGKSVDLFGSQDTVNDAPFNLVITKKGKKSRTDKSTLNQMNQSQPTPSTAIRISVETLSPTCPSTLGDKLDRCVYCALHCELNNSIQCQSCHPFYHLSCCGVDPNIFPSVFDIGKLLRYACEA